VRIRIKNRSLSVMNTNRIWSEYGSVVDNFFIGSPFDNKVKLACNFFSTYINIYSYKTTLCLAWCCLCTIRQNI
jgi:hypothetical protein